MVLYEGGEEVVVVKNGHIGAADDRIRRWGLARSQRRRVLEHLVPSLLPQRLVCSLGSQLRLLPGGLVRHSDSHFEAAAEMTGVVGCSLRPALPHSGVEVASFLDTKLLPLRRQ